MFCIFHQIDQDGQGSAALLKLRHPELKLIGLDYKQPIPFDRMEPGARVYMVDFSAGDADMMRLYAEYDFWWIDHHKTSLEHMAELGVEPHGLRRAEGTSSVELVWEMLEGDAFDGTYPPVVEHIGKWDRWDHTDPFTARIHYGLLVENTDPGNIPLWRSLVSNQAGLLNEVADTGDRIQAFLRQDYSDYRRQAMVEGHYAYRLMDGTQGLLRVVAANRGLTGSPLLEPDFDPEKHDAIMVFYFQKTSWRCSLYTSREDIDLGAIARTLGGGGHRKAAGFSLPEAPFGSQFSLFQQTAPLLV
jgi:hypothetical protein